MSTKRMILLQASAVQAPPSNSGSPGHHRHRPAIQPRKPGDDGAAEQCPHLEEAVLVEQRPDDPAHVIRLLLHLRDRRDQRLVAPVRIVPAAHPRRHVVDRAGQIRQEPPRRVERVFLGIDRMVHRAAAQAGSASRRVPASTAAPPAVPPPAVRPRRPPRFPSPSPSNAPPPAERHPVRRPTRGQARPPAPAPSGWPPGRTTSSRSARPANWPARWFRSS